MTRAGRVVAWDGIDEAKAVNKNPVLLSVPKEPLIKSHVAATVGWALRQARSEEQRVLDCTQATSDKVWGEAQPRPGRVAAKCGAGFVAWLANKNKLFAAPRALPSSLFRQQRGSRGT